MHDAKAAPLLGVFALRPLSSVLPFVHRLSSPSASTAVLVAALALAGCTTTPPRPVVPFTGDPVIDGNAQLAVAPERDKALWEYRVGAAALRQGNFDEAKTKLDNALGRSAAALSAGGTDAERSRRMFGREDIKPFAGEPYERIMGHYYRGLLYWRDGEPDNARALFRSGQFIDSDTENKTYAGDWILLDYLDGFATRKLSGDGSDALARARASAAAQERPSPPDYDPAANVLVFVEFGPGPRKYSSGQYGELLKFTAEKSNVVSARLAVANHSIPLPPYDDVAWQATTRGGRVMDHILGNKAVFKQRSDTIGDVALVGAMGTASMGTGKDSTNVALGLAAVGLISKITSAATQTDADTRSWHNLPRYLSFGAVQLPPGDHPAVLEFFNARGRPHPHRTQTFVIHVPAPDLASAADLPTDVVIIRSDLDN